ncbi:MAG: hypothetical protein CSA76_05165 [Spirochaetales bacterium]|nr:MAG: hypothetical protein CSA76_05165 [Spirochaetales bacterium]
MTKYSSFRHFFKNGGFILVCLILISGLVTTGCQEKSGKISWDYEADVVVVGAGASGLIAALKAVDDGADVLLVETNWDCGGHAAVSEGQYHSGGGTVSQKKWKIEDSADLYYYDHTRGASPDSRYNDTSYVRSVANSMAKCYEFMMKNGAKVKNIEPMVRAYYRDGNDGDSCMDCDSVGRLTYVDDSEWENIYTGTKAAGIGTTRPIEKAARDKGARFLMNYHMNVIFREEQFSGKVLGVQASYTPHIMPGEKEPLKSLFSEGNIESTKEIVNVKAKKAVIIATGGSIGSQEFRTMFDPRLGPEFDGLAGMPFSNQDASGEFAAMKIGASLACLAGYRSDTGWTICAPRRFGCQYGYGRGFTEKSKIWKLVRASGIQPDYSSLCIVNMLGARCGNEDQYAASQLTSRRFEFIENALSSVFIDPDGDGNAECYGGPVWAIFDEAAVKRNDWKMEQGVVDYENGYCFKADTIEELAEKVVNKYYEHIKMDPAILADTIKRYNSFVEKGIDEDWGKTSLDYTIEEGPFYAMWATPSLHDTLAGIKVNESMQVIDVQGNLIPSLFCCGESSGGMRVHGLGRVFTSGYIAGRSAASVDNKGFATADNSLDPAYAGDETNYKTKTDKAEYYAMRYGKLAPMVHSEKEAELAKLGLGGKGSAQTESSGSKKKTKSDDNTFNGFSNKGMGGRMEVTITVKNGKLTDIDVVHTESAGIGPQALTKLVPEAIKKQSAAVDAVSGATMTSEAFKEALSKAMKKAGL